jgi:hypothetical protein
MTGERVFGRSTLELCVPRRKLQPTITRTDELDPTVL